jgi:uncharacterized protein (TIGR03083 family)
VTTGMPDVVALYASQRERIGSLVTGLSAEQLTLTVPCCPAWTVHDVVSHVTGLAVDVADHVPADPSDDARTSFNVELRKDRDVADILAEWNSRADELAPVIPGLGIAGFRFVIDAVIHEDDLREALGLPLSDGPASELLLPSLSAGVAGRRIAKAGLPALTMTAIDSGWSGVAGKGDPAATVRGCRDDLARVLSGRRTRDFAAALEWSGEPEPWIDHLPLFAWHAG